MNNNKRQQINIFNQLMQTVQHFLAVQSKLITKQFLLIMYKMRKDQEAKYYFNNYQSQTRENYDNYSIQITNITHYALRLLK